MTRTRLALIPRLALILCLACATAPAHAQATPPYTAVLIAGDDELPVFDNAAAALDGLLQRTNAATAIIRLSATPQDKLAPSTLDGTLAAIAAMRPAPGQACLVFATSHGVPAAGLYLSHDEEVLTPAALDRALNLGCGPAPTVVIVSSCYSGLFTQGKMPRPNRVILTAARADRTSFGCGAGRTYTVYDRCLLDSLAQDRTWPAVVTSIRACVSAEERRENVQPSLPQASFGAATRSLPVP